MDIINNYLTKKGHANKHDKTRGFKGDVKLKEDVKLKCFKISEKSKAE